MTNNPLAAREAAAREKHFYTVRLSDRDAWFGTTVAAFFNAAGMLLEVGLIRQLDVISSRPAAIAALVGVLLLVVLFTKRKTPSVRWASIIYTINTAAVASALVWTNLPFAFLEKNWVPF